MCTKVTSNNSANLSAMQVAKACSEGFARTPSNKHKKTKYALARLFAKHASVKKN